MDIVTGVLLVAIGIFAGGYGAIVGAGGGFLFVPALLLLFHVDPIIAAGTGLVIVLINSLSGVFGYAKQKRIDYRTGILVGIGAFPGTFIGVKLLQSYSSTYFYFFFASVLVFLGFFLVIKNTNLLKKKNMRQEAKNEAAATGEAIDNITFNPQAATRLQAKWLIPLGFFMGILSSYLGIGGGWMLVPILVYIFRVPTYIATATSIFSLCLYSSVGVFLQVWHGNIDWLIVAFGGAGIILGSQLGVFLSQKIPSRIIMQMLSFLLIVIGFRMYFH
ncbi:sulfite exporter TauE/SafE family protein [Fredinandcohnia sp. QZ13]|uniref:sulfite exporter TauE/SafE family protein n=1 Tax=Fredinandcohnia sp. QZ13 TaxID=3073144 RepID=UPI00285330F0|nr:sulfite exporter TauE/SafE family protein [Fredinandcohnia sp. QZ13]MDR4889966.1 sulfite exporter TauE/SafE family protein [Fredinandcohnia sp. QZ13]